METITSSHWAVGESETSVSPDCALRDRARDAIRAGLLPRQHPESIWGGPGSGVSCAVCGQPVRRDGLGLELAFEDAEARLGPRHVHVPCFAASERECEHFLQAANDADTSATMSESSRERRMLSERPVRCSPRAFWAPLAAQKRSRSMRSTISGDEHSRTARTHLFPT